MSNNPENPRARVGELQHEIARAIAASRLALDDAMQVAWQIGCLLDAERSRIRRSMGRGAWQHWLAENVRGSRRLAERYLKLARAVDSPEKLKELSLRQAYFRLGISTEPKVRADARGLPSLPGHVRNAQKLLLSVRMKIRLRKMDEGQRRRLCEDLGPLYRQLVLLFAANERPGTRGSHPERNRH